MQHNTRAQRMLLQSYEQVCKMYRRVVTVENVGKLMSMVMPVLIAKEHVRTYINSFFPSYIERIVHMDPSKGETKEIYVAFKKRYTIRNAVYDLLGLSKEGYYMFVVWNNMSLQYERYLIQANMLEKALEIKNIYNLWTLNEFAIILMLNNYVKYAGYGTNRIFQIFINRKDVTKKLRPFLSSISVPNNVRPNVLYMLVQYLNREEVNMIEMKSSFCVCTDYDLEEIRIPNATDYLFPQGTTDNPIMPTIYREVELRAETDAMSSSTNQTNSESEVEEIFEEKDKDA